MAGVVQLGNRSAIGIDWERSELREVLASRAFARSPRLLALLEYISEKHFLGRSNEVCEYSIATEVLGRQADFDPAQDAISRVEMHRLRKKLREYYASEGINRPVRIVIPSGLYTPVFQTQSAPATSAASSPSNSVQTP